LCCCAVVRSQRHRLRCVRHAAAAAPRSCYSTCYERYCGGRRAAGSVAWLREHSMLPGCALFVLGCASYRGLCPAMLVIALPASLRGMQGGYHGPASATLALLFYRCPHATTVGSLRILAADRPFVPSSCAQVAAGALHERVRVRAH
jgi:hypothetical protein